MDSTDPDYVDYVSDFESLKRQILFLTTDWDGTEMNDIEETRIPVRCGLLKDLLDEISYFHGRDNG